MTNEEVLQQLIHLVGTRYVPGIKAYISDLTGRARVVGLSEASTLEYDPKRIHVSGNAEGIILGFNFG